MGEYALHRGEQIKIGTCEDMYYLRADQAKLVKPLQGNVDPIKDQEEIRFRFPWPDEDGMDPGTFEQHERSLGLHGIKIKVPDGVDHQNVQFKADAGYLLSLSCPESGEEGPASDHGLKFHRNGFAGSVHIVQQCWVAGKLVLVCKCGGCGAKYRIPTLKEAKPVIDALVHLAEQAKRRNEGTECPDFSPRFYLQIAERIEAGYTTR